MNSEAIFNDDVINLLDIFKYIRKYGKLIIITTVIGLVFGIVLSLASFLRGEMSKQYVIKSSIAVTSQTSDGLFTSQSLNPNSTDIHLAEDMVDSVIFVIRSDRTIDKAVEELQLIGISAKDVQDNLELSQYNKTQIIDISLYWRNAEEGIKILEAINTVSPKILVDILKIGDVRVVNNPTAKYLIGGSIKATTWLTMTALGALAGILISVIMMFARPTVLNSYDVQNRLGLKVIGAIPKDKHYLKKGTLIQNEDANSNKEITDSYLSATHILEKTAENQNGHIFYVTSTNRAEGRTSVTANLGMHLADLEKKVLLIDMDFIAPNLGSKFVSQVSYEHSLNAVYQGDTSIDEAIIPVNGFLHVLPLIHDVQTIVLNEAILSIIKAKVNEYDYTIIDTSAIGNAADILRLNKITDGALFVVQYDRCTLSSIREALLRLEKTEIPVVGCIVNQTDRFA